jgi:hypothetical protein
MVQLLLDAFLFIAGGALGWWRGSIWRREKVAEETEHVIQKRRNALLIRGRHTDRRPEHDGSASRQGRVRVVSRRPTLPGTPPDQL